MSESNIYRPKMNEKEIRETVLKNTVKMLMARGDLKGYKLTKSKAKKKYLKKYYAELVESGNDDHIYTITGVPREEVVKSKKDKEEVKIVVKKFAVKLYPDVLNSVNVQSVKDFLNKYSEYHKILIVAGATQNPYDDFMKNPNSELFFEEELLICLIETVVVPPHIPIRTANGLKKIMKTFNINKVQFEDIFTEQDPVARFFNLKVDEIVMILRPSETSLISPGWRRAKKGSRFKTLVKNTKKK